MPILNVTGIGLTGSNNDREQSTLPVNAWTDLNNVRSYNGQLQSINHPVEVLNVETTPDLDPDYPQAIIGYQNVNSIVAYASDVNIYTYSQGVHVLVTDPMVNTIVDSNDWNSINFNNSIVFSNPLSVPQILTPDATDFVDMPEWGYTTGHVDWFCGKMTSYKTFLVALNMTEDDVQYKQRVRWSDVAVPNLSPSNWDATLIDHPSSLAGFNDLTDATGEILTGLTLNDTYYIYTDREIFAMQYVGGSSVFAFRKINGDINCYNKNSVIQYKNLHIIVSRNNVYQFNGTSAESIIDGKIRDKLFRDINETYRNQVKIIGHQQFNEVWILYPTVNSVSGECNKAAVFNSEDGTWSFRNIDGIVSIANVQQPDEASIAWDDEVDFWNDADSPWLTSQYGSDILLYSNNEGKFFLADHQEVSNNIINASMERKYIDFDDVGIEPTAIKRINAIYPLISGTGTVKVYVGTSNSSGGAITYESPKTFTIGDDVRLDFRVSGKFFSLKFVMDARDSQWIFTGYQIDLEERFNSRRRNS